MKNPAGAGFPCNLMKKLILTGFLSLLMPGFSFPQESRSPDLQGYRKSTDFPLYTPGNLWDFINGAADNYLLYGFQALNVTEYRKGRNVIRLEIYRHRDPVNAFGIYSVERSPSFGFISVGAQGYRAGNSLNFFKGSYYVKIRTQSGSDKVLRQLENLALRVADMLPGDQSMPKTLSDFPESGRKNNEETYLAEAVLGHKFLKGAFRANYEDGDTGFAIYIIDRKTTEEASVIASEYLKKAGIEADDAAGGKFVFRDGYNGDIFLSWKGSRIVIIQGLERDQTDIAERYTSEILG